MRWLTYRAGGDVRAGLLGDDGTVHGLQIGIELIDLIRQGRGSLAEAADEARVRPDHVASVDEIELLAPIPRPPSLRDFLGFLDHHRIGLRAQGRSDALPPAWEQIPAMYFGNPASVVGPRDEVAIFPGSQQFDLELEVAAIIGIEGRDLDPETAHTHIAGYTMFCDWTARDVQAGEARLAVGQGKGKDGANTLGPWLVTPDELDDVTTDGQPAVEVSASVNGHELALGNVGAADWKFREIVAYASRGTSLRVGDVIGSGTLPGGCLAEHLDGSDPADFDRWLQPGDVIEIGGDRLGYTRNVIVAAAPVRPLRTGY
jgi:2-keto-4-pentenoate hydratase/2-oxohepta-3-ene-1,7-dioic acid hydratase in catechol pathway